MSSESKIREAQAHLLAATRCILEAMAEELREDIAGNRKKLEREIKKQKTMIEKQRRRLKHV